MEAINVARARVTGCLKQDITALDVQKEYREAYGKDCMIHDANAFITIIKQFSEQTGHRKLTDDEIRDLIKRWESDYVNMPF